VPRKTAAHDLVEEELGVAVDVQRRLVLAFLAEHPTAAIDRGRRGIEVRDLLLRAEIQQLQREAVVVGHHVTAVGFHRVGAGALVQDGLDTAIELAVLDHVEELVLVEIVGDLAIGEVEELVGARQVVDRDDVGYAALVERLDQVCAYEPAGAGDT
jgi:hypothetical protein